MVFDSFQRSPSRQDSSDPVHLIQELSRVTEYISDQEDLSLINRAYLFARERHGEQKRESGEPYISHLVAVANILIEFKLDPVSIAGALLHDIIEDTGTTESEVGSLFGDHVLDIVKGMTKLPKQEFVSGDKHQAENYRKMIFASIQDLRVIFIKLADRLHNMRTLKYVPEQKRLRIARETLEIYAPLANRLGIEKIKSELEDLAFHHLEPDIYQQIRNQMNRKWRDREKFVTMCSRIISEKLVEAGIAAEVTGRPKHFYSIYQKMKRSNIPFENIFDLTGVRIVCLDNEVKFCYHVLGIIHTLWPPIQGRFKDYIAIPKSNMYRSIHTTVMGPQGLPLEIQIRTREMNRLAEIGIASHWKYKERDKVDGGMQEQVNWLHQLIDWMKEMEDPRDFLENFKIDLFPNEIYVFTPAGEVKFLPRGATPVDFAYAIHSDIGNSCVGAKVNGRMVTLHYQLKSGDRVDILTSKKHMPSQDWLKFVKTSKAKSKIKKIIRERHRQHSIELGKDILKQEFKKHHVDFTRYFRSNLQDLVAVAKTFNLPDVDELLHLVGIGRLNAGQISRSLFPEPSGDDGLKTEVIEETRISKMIKRVFGQDSSLQVDGIENMLIVYAKCCNPVMGDEIVGFITRGRGITIHTRDCLNITRSDADSSRIIDVTWTGSHKTEFNVYVEVTGKDRKGLFSDISSVITKLNSNIVSCQLNAKDENNDAVGVFLLEVKDITHLNKVIAAINKVKGITKVSRIRQS